MRAVEHNQQELQEVAVEEAVEEDGENVSGSAGRNQVQGNQPMTVDDSLSWAVHQQ